MKGWGIEARVGAFVLAALGILIGFVLTLGDFSLNRGVTMYADFAFTSGLQVGAPVMMSGIRVGRVRSLSILDPAAQPPPAESRLHLGQRDVPRVRADLEVDAERVGLFAHDTLLHVGTQGLIGEAYIEVTPGEGAPLAPGAVLRGVDAPRLHVMALQLSAVLSAVGGLVGVVEQGQADLGEVGDAIAALLSTLGEVVGERRTELSQALADLAASAADLRALLGHVRAAADDGRAVRQMMADAEGVLTLLRADLPPILQRTRDSVDAARSLLTKADGAIDHKALAEIVADVRTATSRLEAAARDAQRVVQRIERGEGTVGGLVTDPQIFDDIKEMLRDLKRNPWKFLWRD